MIALVQELVLFIHGTLCKILNKKFITQKGNLKKD